MRVREVSFPASDLLVLGVGGTTLTANARPAPTLARPPGQIRGGGFSHLCARLACQDGVPGISKTRGVPDVSGDANQVGGIAWGVVADGGVG